MGSSSPPGWAGAPGGCVGYLTSGSGAPTTSLAPVHLRAGAAHDLGAVRLLGRRSVLVDALLLAVLAVERLPHLRLQVVVRAGLLVTFLGSHRPTLAPDARLVEWVVPRTLTRGAGATGDRAAGSRYAGSPDRSRPASASRSSPGPGRPGSTSSARCGRSPRAGCGPGRRGLARRSRAASRRSG